MKQFITLTSIAVALISSSVEAASCSAIYGQCGGTGYTGPTCCATGSSCVPQEGNEFYSQCLPDAITVQGSSECSAFYGQCGGEGWTGPTCCVSGSTCVAQEGNKYYSQCLPEEDSGANSVDAAATTKKKTTTKKATTTKKHTTTKKPTTTKKTTKKTSTKKTSTKKTTTKKSTTKKTTTKKTTTKKSTTKKTTTTKKPTTTKKTTTTKKATTTKSAGSSSYSPISGGSSGSGSTTRYWDCCKASCSWPGKASVSAPVDTCGANGISLLDDNAVSGCNGGNGFMCNNNQPWAVNDNLAYGFAAASISGSSESGWCCGCYELTFTSTAIAGKKMVVQVTNTGGDLGANHFDLQIPGGGVGIFNGCSAQWGAPSEGWGARYGGVSDVSACSSLPSALQAGCKWRFNWFKNADNPSMTFKEVTCPAELVSRTGCKRN